MRMDRLCRNLQRAVGCASKVAEPTEPCGKIDAVLLNEGTALCSDDTDACIG